MRYTKTIAVVSFIGLIASAMAFGPGPAKSAFPSTCVLWPIFTFDDGYALFYCDYFPTACNNPPQLAYAYLDAQFNGFPQTCDACMAHKGKAIIDTASKKTYCPGMEAQIDPDDPCPLPTGPASQFARVLTDPDLEYIYLVDASGHKRCAKVFLLGLDKDAVGSEIPTGADRYIHVAYEINGVPPEEEGIDVETAVSSHPLDQGPCHVYDCTCALGETNFVVHVLVFLAEESGVAKPLPSVKKR